MERRQDKIEAIDKELAELEAKEKNLPHDYLADDYSRDLHESSDNLRNYILKSSIGAVYTPYNTRHEDIRIKERIAYLKHIRSKM